MGGYAGNRDGVEVEAHCVVCGDTPTVKSHLIPRAIFHDMKRPSHPIVGNTLRGPGYVELQSGYFDRSILCARHEAMLGPPDNYGVRFCRSFIRQVAQGTTHVRVANPKPDLLVKFAGACIWRAATSRTQGNPSRWLGPYAERIERSLFGDVEFRPLLLVSRQSYRSSTGEPLNIGALPHRYQELGVNFWRFIAGGLIFDLKLDNRSTPPAMRTLDASQMSDLLLMEDFPQSALQAPGIGTALARMAMRRVKEIPPG